MDYKTLHRKLKIGNTNPLKSEQNNNDRISIVGCLAPKG